MHRPCSSIYLERMAARAVRLTTGLESGELLALNFGLGEILLLVIYKMGGNDASAKVA